MFWKREQYRNLSQQNILSYTTSVSFSVLLVIMIRSCLAKEDNTGVYKSTGCLTSSQLTFPGLFSFREQGSTKPLQHDVSLGTVWSSAAEILAQCSLGAPWGLQEVWFLIIFECICSRVKKVKRENHLAEPLSVFVLSQPWLSHPYFPPCRSCQSCWRRKGLSCWKQTEGLCFKPEK